MHSKMMLALAGALALLMANIGCGGSTAQQVAASIPIVVSVVPTTATVQPASQAKLTADVSNDPSNSGVRWDISCATATCGTISPPTTTSGANAIYTAPPNFLASTSVTVTATAVADSSKSSSATLIPVGYIPSYDVGVDYHSFGADIDTTGFMGVYDQAPARQMVQTQLQEMADRGATIIRTGIGSRMTRISTQMSGSSFP